jgi:hypothetical protein
MGRVGDEWKGKEIADPSWEVDSLVWKTRHTAAVGEQLHSTSPQIEYMSHEGQ